MKNQLIKLIDTLDHEIYEHIQECHLYSEDPAKDNKVTELKKARELMKGALNHL